MSRSIYTPGQWRWIGERYKEGYPTCVLAEFLDMTPTNVCKQLRKHGVQKKKRVGEWGHDPALAAELEGRKREFYALLAL